MGSIQANCQYRIRKDSAIWLSASKFGFEAFRAFITPDSIFALNRFGKEYYAEDISELANEYGFPGDFSILQELLVGNPWLPETEETKFLFSPDSIMVQTLFQGFYIRHGSYTPMTQVDFSEVTDSLGRGAYVTYNDYQLYDNEIKIPYFRVYEVDDGAGQQGTAEFTFKEIEINVPQNLPFSIPKSFTKGAL
jgi:hypothetical protein